MSAGTGVRRRTRRAMLREAGQWWADQEEAGQ